MTPAWQPRSPWVPCTAPLTSGTACRSPKLLWDIVEQFHVEQSARYAPKESKTYCNIFVSDVTTALGCPVYHWWMGAELNANATYDWLSKKGASHGWNLAAKTVAHSYAKDGRPAVAVWKNPTGASGHIAILLPPSGPEIEIAQAGIRNYQRCSLEQGFGKRIVTFFVHN